MEDFYAKLWDKKVSGIEAFARCADPDALRGAFRGLGPLLDGESADAEQRLPSFNWAAFVLSGDWR